MRTPPRFLRQDLLGWLLVLALLGSGWGTRPARVAISAVIGVWTYRRFAFAGEPDPPTARARAGPRDAVLAEEIPPPFTWSGTFTLATHGVLPLLVARGAALGPLPVPTISWGERSDWTHWSLDDDLALATMAAHAICAGDPLAPEVFAMAEALRAGETPASGALAERIVREGRPDPSTLFLLFPAREAVARAAENAATEDPSPTARPLALLLAAARSGAQGLLSYYTYRRIAAPCAEYCEELVRCALDRDPGMMPVLEGAARERLAARAATREAGDAA